jgi:PPOX class probable F420-dependent enzyme
MDEKPKRRPAARLKRIRNIESNPNVSLVIDEYHEDWRKLAYVIVNGTAEILEPGPEQARAVGLLRQKYPQYVGMALDERPAIKITPTKIISWGTIF